MRDRPADSHGEGGPFQVGGPVADALYMFVRVGSVCAGQAGASKKWHYSCAIKPHTHGKGQHKLGISAPISAPPYDASVLSPSVYPTKWDCSVGVEAGGHTKHDGLRHVALWRWCGGCGRHETRWPTPRGIVEMLLSCPPAVLPLSGIALLGRCGGWGRHETRRPTPRGIVEMLRSGMGSREIQERGGGGEGTHAGGH